MVCQLGTGLGRVWKSLRRPGHHGRFLLHYHDRSVQAARPGAGLAEGSHQMVAASASNAATEGSSLRIESVSKDFPAASNDAVRTTALDGVTLSVAAGELVSIVVPNGCGESNLLSLIADIDTTTLCVRWSG